MTWLTVNEEYPEKACRRCDRAYYADDAAGDRINISEGASTHIERLTLGRASAAVLIILLGGRATYCGLRVSATVDYIQDHDLTACCGAPTTFYETTMVCRRCERAVEYTLK